MKKSKFRRYSRILALVVLCAVMACSEDDLKITPVEALAVINNLYSDTDSTYLVGSQPYGRIAFIQDEDSVVTIEVYLENFLPNTIHSLHIHKGSCEQPGAHWNQGFDMTTSFCSALSLNTPWAKPMAGDIGNVSVGYDGSGYFSIKTDLWSLNSDNEKNITGLAVIIHETFDDFNAECNANHDHNHTHANAKIGCGVISLVE